MVLILNAGAWVKKGRGTGRNEFLKPNRYVVAASYIVTNIVRNYKGCLL